MNRGLHNFSRQLLADWVKRQGQLWSWDRMDFLTTTQDYIVKPNAVELRVYAVAQGGNGEPGGASNGPGGSGGGGGGMAFGEIAVSPGERIRANLAGNAIFGADFTALPGAAGGSVTSGIGGLGGTASISARVKNGGAYSGGQGGNSGAGNWTGAGGGSSGSPLGAGLNGASGTSGGYSSSALGGGWGLQYSATRTIANRYTDILLAIFSLAPGTVGCDGMGGQGSVVGGFGGGGGGSPGGGTGGSGPSSGGYGGGGGGGANSSTNTNTSNSAPGQPVIVVFYRSKS